jgi:hypothetical protein
MNSHIPGRAAENLTDIRIFRTEIEENNHRSYFICFSWSEAVVKSLVREAKGLQKTGQNRFGPSGKDRKKEGSWLRKENGEKKRLKFEINRS